MMKLVFLLSAVGLLAGAAISYSPTGSMGQSAVFQKLLSVPLDDNQAAFVFLGYSGVVVRTAKGTLIIDPADLLLDKDIAAFQGKTVDAVLYTHGHGDHFDLATATGLFKATGAVIGAESQVAQALKRSGAIPAGKIVDFGANPAQTLGAWTIKAVRGQHVGPIVLFHMATEGIGIFHGGDSNYVPLKNLAAGLAFLPAGDPSPTASPDAALKMARDLKPRVVVLFHGSDAQYQEFKKKAQTAMPGTEVIIPETMKVYTVKLS
jgi:L-ascorbate metabolism protein UlaG (beta-lactamase superfamily)